MVDICPKSPALRQAWHRTDVQWNLQKKRRQAGGEGDVQGVAESGSKPGSVSLQSPCSFPEPRKRREEKDGRRAEIMVQVKRGSALRGCRPVPLAMELDHGSSFLVASARLCLFQRNSMQRLVLQDAKNHWDYIFNGSLLLPE